MDVERTIDDIEQLEEMFEAPDIRPLSAKRHLGCESKARRNARAQPLVSALAAGMASVADLRLRYFNFRNESSISASA